MTVAADQPLDEDTLEHEPGGPGAGADIIVVLCSYVALGILCGVLWWLVVDPAHFTKGADGGAMAELELGKQFNADGWYTVIAAVAGFLSGVGLTWWRGRDLRLTTVLVLLGSAAAAALMVRTGNLLGPDDPDTLVAAAKVGERIPVELVVTAPAAYLAWPIAALVGALMVLWSPPRDGERPTWP